MTGARRGLALGVAAFWMATASGLPAADAPERAGEVSALAWLAAVDAGKYGESWDESAGLFKAFVSRAQWEAALEKSRRPLGKVVSRHVRESKYLTSIPNAPDGEYVAILYDTSFENAPSVQETVTPTREKDGVWRVAGYFIK
jgi:hypothetical protein